jgi:phage terminase large subunit
MRDFETIMTSHHYWDENRWNRTDSIYTFETGSKLEFFSADQSSKIRGPSRDRLFVNEANNITQESWEQLLFRTREFAFADWNPVGNFFLYDDYELNDKDGAETGDDRVDFLILTYRDNESLEPSIIEDIERKAALNPGWARVYAEGKRGEMEGKIFTGWKIYDEVPHEARLEVRGLDFGYAQDPAALCDIYSYNGSYIIDELVYRKGMLNRQLADVILNQRDPNVLTIADSAEPKSIAEMQEYGVNIIGVEKRGIGGLNFTNSAIQFVQGQKMGITKRSLRYLKSYRSFMWQTDKDGKIIPKYDHFESDGMMSVVYGMTSFAPRERDEVTEYSSGSFTSNWL